MNTKTLLPAVLIVVLAACAAPALTPPASPGAATAARLTALPREATPAPSGDRPDGAERLYAPAAPASAQNAQFSPDGGTLLFTLFHNGYNLGPAGLYLLSLGDRAPTVLFDEPDQDSVNLPGSSWNAATNRITFASDREDANELWMMDADGTGLSRVTRHASPPLFVEPSFSPDGRWIVFEASADAPESERQGSLWKVRADGAGLTQLTGDEADDRQPNWSPAGDRILFQRRAPGSDDWNLFTLAADGSDIRPVTDTPSEDTDGSWSPDGRWIVYSSDHGGLPAPNLFVISAEGGRPIRLTRDETHADGAASWSPDGEWIAFESYASDDEESLASLWRISANGRPRLAAVSRWLYLLDVNLGAETVDRIAASDYDMVVLDFIPSEVNNTDYPMADVVARLRDAPHPKLVLAYIDVGQAENYRTYWQAGWRIGNPDWIAGEDPDGWAGNFPVGFWREAWRETWLGENGYLQAILDAGFDGVYLDWIEAYSDENVIALAVRDDVDPKEEMIRWIGDLAGFGRARRPGFIVIGQNAAELAERDDYLGIVDAMAQEQVWFDGAAEDDPPGDCPLPRTDAEVDTETYRESLSPPCREVYEQYPDSTLHVSSEEYLRYLTLARDRGEIVFTVDYALEPQNVAWVYRTSRALGFVPFAGSRALDQYVEPAP